MRSKKWIFLALGFFLLVGGGTSAWLVLHFSNVDQVKIKEALQKETASWISVKDWNLKVSKINWSKLSVEVEALAPEAQLGKVLINTKIIPKALRILGDFKIFDGFRAKSLALQLSSQKIGNVFLKGGISALPLEKGWMLDLTDLELRSGSFEKKMGYPLNFEFKGSENRLLFAGQEWKALITQSDKGFIFEIPSQTKNILKQKLPLHYLTDFSATGDLEFSLKIDSIAGALMVSSRIKGKELLLNLADGQLWGVESQRGIAKLHFDSDSNLGTNLFKLDLSDGTFDLKGSKTFKTQGAPMLLTGEEKDGVWSLALSFADGNAKLKANSKEITAEWDHLPLELLPLKSSFPVTIAGQSSGQGLWTLKENSFGESEVDSWSLKLSQSSVFGRGRWSYQDVDVRGAFEFYGQANLLKKSNESPQLMGAKGKVVLDDSELSVSSYFKKPEKEALELSFDSLSNPQRPTMKAYMASVQGEDVKAELSFDLPEGAAKKIHNLQVKLFNIPLQSKHWPADILVNGTLSTKNKEFRFDKLKAQLSKEIVVLLNGNMGAKDASLDVNVEATLASLKFLDPFLWIKDVDSFSKLNVSLSLNKEDSLEKEWKANFSGSLKDRKWFLEDVAIETKGLKATGRGEFDLTEEQTRNGVVSLTSTLKLLGDLKSFANYSPQTKGADELEGSFEGEVVLASKGFNLDEWIKKAKGRINGNFKSAQGGFFALLAQGLSSYVEDESKIRDTFEAKKLSECVPHQLSGKLDLEFAEGNWDLSPSLAQGLDRDSMIKFEGNYKGQGADKLAIQLSYLPGPQCSASLSGCLGDAFPKGGIPLAISGTFREPEAELDFAFLDQALETCRGEKNTSKIASAKNNTSGVAQEINRQQASVDVAEQKLRLKELKEVYRVRRRAP